MLGWPGHRFTGLWMQLTLWEPTALQAGQPEGRDSPTLLSRCWLGPISPSMGHLDLWVLPHPLDLRLPARRGSHHHLMTFRSPSPGCAPLCQAPWAASTRPWPAGHCTQEVPRTCWDSRLLLCPGLVSCLQLPGWGAWARLLASPTPTLVSLNPPPGHGVGACIGGAGGSGSSGPRSRPWVCQLPLCPCLSWVPPPLSRAMAACGQASHG